MAAPARISATQYFEVEQASEVRHELSEGQLYAMAGGTPTHARLQSRIGAILGNRLPEGCDTYGADLRVAVRSDTYFYPDHTIICGTPELEPGTPSSVTNPLIVFEVLSESTEDFDRGRKAALYRQIETLASVVLIAQNRAEVEVQSRLPDGSWALRTYAGLEAEATLAAIDVTLPLRDLYAGIDFPQ